MKIKLLKVAKFYRRLYGAGHKLAPPPNNFVNFQNFAELYLRSLKTYHFHICMAILLILRRWLAFLVVSTDFPWLVKIEKTMEGSIINNQIK